MQLYILNFDRYKSSGNDKKKKYMKMTIIFDNSTNLNSLLSLCSFKYPLSITNNQPLK